MLRIRSQLVPISTHRLSRWQTRYPSLLLPQQHLQRHDPNPKLRESIQLHDVHLQRLEHTATGHSGLLRSKMSNHLRPTTRLPPRTAAQRNPPRHNHQLQHLRHKRNKYHGTMAGIFGRHGAARHCIHRADRSMNGPRRAVNVMAAVSALLVGQLSRGTHARC